MSTRPSAGPSPLSTSSFQSSDRYVSSRNLWDTNLFPGSSLGSGGAKRALRRHRIPLFVPPYEKLPTAKNFKKKVGHSLPKWLNVENEETKNKFPDPEILELKNPFVMPRHFPRSLMKTCPSCDNDSPQTAKYRCSFCGLTYCSKCTLYLKKECEQGNNIVSKENLSRDYKMIVICKLCWTLIRKWANKTALTTLRDVKTPTAVDEMEEFYVAKAHIIQEEKKKELEMRIKKKGNKRQKNKTIDNKYENPDSVIEIKDFNPLSFIGSTVTGHNSHKNIEKGEYGIESDSSYSLECSEVYDEENNNCKIPYVGNCDSECLDNTVTKSPRSIYEKEQQQEYNQSESQISIQKEVWSDYGDNSNKYLNKEEQKYTNIQSSRESLTPKHSSLAKHSLIGEVNKDIEKTGGKDETSNIEIIPMNVFEMIPKSFNKKIDKLINEQLYFKDKNLIKIWREFIKDNVNTCLLDIILKARIQEISISSTIFVESLSSLRTPEEKTDDQLSCNCIGKRKKYRNNEETEDSTIVPYFLNMMTPSIRKNLSSLDINNYTHLSSSKQLPTSISGCANGIALKLEMLKPKEKHLEDSIDKPIVLLFGSDVGGIHKELYFPIKTQIKLLDYTKWAHLYLITEIVINIKKEIYGKNYVVDRNCPLKNSVLIFKKKVASKVLIFLKMYGAHIILLSQNPGTFKPLVKCSCKTTPMKLISKLWQADFIDKMSGPLEPYLKGKNILAVGGLNITLLGFSKVEIHGDLCVFRQTNMGDNDNFTSPDLKKYNFMNKYKCILIGAKDISIVPYIKIIILRVLDEMVGYLFVSPIYRFMFMLTDEVNEKKHTKEIGEDKQNTSPNTEHTLSSNSSPLLFSDQKQTKENDETVKKEEMKLGGTNLKFSAILPNYDVEFNKAKMETLSGLGHNCRNYTNNGSPRDTSSKSLRIWVSKSIFQVCDEFKTVSFKYPLYNNITFEKFLRSSFTRHTLCEKCNRQLDDHVFQYVLNNQLIAFKRITNPEKVKTDGYAVYTDENSEDDKFYCNWGIGNHNIFIKIVCHTCKTCWIARGRPLISLPLPTFINIFTKGSFQLPCEHFMLDEAPMYIHLGNIIIGSRRTAINPLIIMKPLFKTCTFDSNDLETASNSQQMSDLSDSSSHEFLYEDLNNNNNNTNSMLEGRSHEASHSAISPRFSSRYLENNTDLIKDSQEHERTTSSQRQIRLYSRFFSASEIRESIITEQLISDFSRVLSECCLRGDELVKKHGDNSTPLSVSSVPITLDKVYPVVNAVDEKEEEEANAGQKQNSEISNNNNNEMLSEYIPRFQTIDEIIDHLRYTLELDEGQEFSYYKYSNNYYKNVNKWKHQKEELLDAATALDKLIPPFDVYDINKDVLQFEENMMGIIGHPDARILLSSLLPSYFPQWPIKQYWDVQKGDRKLHIKSYYPFQFNCIQRAYIGKYIDKYDPKHDVVELFGYSLRHLEKFAPKAGKSGARFFLTKDGNFLIKCITKTEIKRFKLISTLYFQYMFYVINYNAPSLVIPILQLMELKVDSESDYAKFVLVMPNIHRETERKLMFDIKGVQKKAKVKFAGVSVFDILENINSPEESNTFHKNVEKDIQNYSYTTLQKETKCHQQVSQLNSPIGNMSPDNVSDYDEPILLKTGDEQQQQSNLRGEPSRKRSISTNNNSNGLIMGDYELQRTGCIFVEETSYRFISRALANDIYFLNYVGSIDYSIMGEILLESNHIDCNIGDYLRGFGVMEKLERGVKFLIAFGKDTTVRKPLTYALRLYNNTINKYLVKIPNNP